MLIKELAAEAARLSDCSREHVIVNAAKRAAIAAFREEEKSTIQRIASNLLTLGVTLEDIEISTGLKKDEISKLHDCLRC